MATVLTTEQREHLHRRLDEILDRLPAELKDLEEAEQQIEEGLRRLGEATMQAWAESTAPVAGNDHCLEPADWAEKAFLDYGPLFDALRGRRWVLEPHVLNVRDGKARANLFRVPDGYVIPLVMAAGSQPVTIDMPAAVFPGDPANMRVLVMHLGSTAGTPVPPRVESGRWSLDVPTVRGCALVKIETGPR